MKTIKISFQGVVDAFAVSFGVIVVGAFLFFIGFSLWQRGFFWSWKIPAVAGGMLGVAAIFAGLGWLYDKNPTIKIGGKPKLPKAKVVTNAT